MTHVSDESLWTDAIRGDEYAATMLSRRLRPPMFRCAHHAGGNSTADVEDVVAASFLKMWEMRHRATFVAGSALPWALSVTRFVALNAARSEHRQARLLRALADPELVDDHAPTCDDLMDLRLTLDIIRKALGTLPARDLAVARCCLVEETPVTQAAVRLGIPVGTVKSRLHRIRRVVQLHLAGAAPHESTHGMNPSQRAGEGVG